MSDNLVSYWKLDETSGNRADSAGSNTLTDNNTVGYNTGMNGNAASFVAANSESLTHASLAVATDYTYNLWVWTADVSTSKGMLSNDDGNSYYQTSNPVIRVQSNAWFADVGAGYPVPNESVQASAGANSATASTWTMLTVKYTASTKKVSIAKNGGVFASSAALVNPVLTTGQTFRIGAWGSTYFNGLIDEVGYWSRILTAQGITDLYNAGAGLFY